MSFYKHFLGDGEIFVPYLHDDEEHQGDEDVDLRVFPGLRVADVVELLCDALFGPRPVVQQRHQRLLLSELNTTGSDIINTCYWSEAHELRAGH